MFSVVLEARPPGTPNGVARGVGHRKRIKRRMSGWLIATEFMGFGRN